MPQFDEPAVSLRFELSGRSTSNIKGYRIESAFMTSTDAFEMTLYEPDRELRRNLELQPVQVFIDGLLQVTGRIDETTMGGSDGTSVMVRGRDYMSDLVECNVDPSLRLEENQALGDAVLLAASPAGIDGVEDGGFAFRNVRTGVSTENGVDDTFRELKLGKYKANPGEGIYQFLNRLCARHGCTLQPTSDRNRLALARPDYGQGITYRLRRYLENPAARGSNVITSTAKRNYGQYPTYVLVSGKQGRPGGKKFSVSTDSNGTVTEIKESVVAAIPPLNATMELFLPGRDASLVLASRIKPGEVKRPTSALYRMLYLKDEQSRKQAQIDRSMIRALSERVKDSLQYTCVLRGHRDPESGALYQPDTIIDVNDEPCELAERLWVERRVFSYDENSGPTTELTAWRVGSFEL